MSSELFIFHEFIRISPATNPPPPPRTVGKNFNILQTLNCIVIEKINIFLQCKGLQYGYIAFKVRRYDENTEICETISFERRDERRESKQQLQRARVCINWS